MLIAGVVVGLVLLLTGAPVFVAFAAGGGVICAYFLNIPWFPLAQLMLESVSKHVLLAIPFFILSASLMM